MMQVRNQRGRRMFDYDPDTRTIEIMVDKAINRVDLNELDRLSGQTAISEQEIGDGSSKLDARKSNRDVFDNGAV